MDLDEWELLPDYGFLDVGGNKIFSNDFKTDYFSCPSPKTKSHNFSDPGELRRPIKQIIHLPVQLDPSSSSSSTTDEQKVDQAPKLEPDHDVIVSQVSFKKITKENEFVEMKMDSPRPRSRSPFDLDSFQFEMETDIEEVTDEEEKVKKDDTDGGGLNIWKRSLNGIGAICSFGVAAATFCFIVLGTQQQKNKRDLRFQIYGDDKRIKQVMAQHAAKMNGAISAMRGVPVPLARAHITVGGYYDGL